MQDLTVSLVQTHLFWEDVEANLAHFESKLKTLGTTDLIVLPETFNTGFTMNARPFAEPINGRTVNWLKQQSAAYNAAICGSLVIDEHGKLYNRFIIAYPDGTIDFYNKRHLFSIGGEHEVFECGIEKRIWDVKGWKICPQVCYDLRFPVWSRNAETYDMLVYTANWPLKRMPHWMGLIPARSIENQCYVAALSRIGFDGEQVEQSGHSCFADFDGIILQNAQNNDIILTQTFSIKPLLERREIFPVLKDADVFKVNGLGLS
ncbi:MAG: amidohydrolase [Flavobacteriales bacterium]|nr:amidohydrolase [Flavobacteriales bacterium]